MMLKKIVIPVVGFALICGLSACSNDTAQSGADTAASGSAVSQQAPEVDRSGEGVFPEVKGGFGEKPEFTPATGAEPFQIKAKTLVQGNGPVVKADDYVMVNYAGVLWDGTPFDSSFDRGEPAAFSLNAVIAGWKYGLADQKVGDRVLLTIPSQWGYGESGSGKIPAGATLVFVVDILDSLDTSDTSALTAGKPTSNPLPEGVTVTGDLGAEPTVAYAAGEAPKEQQIVVLAEGSGDKIADTDQVVIRSVAALQGNTEPLPSAWDQPEVIPAAAAQLSGYTVGTRLALVRPSAAEGQPAVVIVADLTAAMKQAK